MSVCKTIEETFNEMLDVKAQHVCWGRQTSRSHGGPRFGEQPKDQLRINEQVKVCKDHGGLFENVLLPSGDSPDVISRQAVLQMTAGRDGNAGQPFRA